MTDTGTATSEPRIEPVRDAAARRTFLSLPAALQGHDPNWITPLALERRQHLDPRRNPYFAHAEAAFWVAWAGRRCVGRISAQIDHLALETHGDAAGHFGFLEAADDPKIFAALLGAAEAWLRERGMRRVRGPYSLSINDECGLLVDGFDAPPYFLMGHAPPYYAARLEACGYTKAKDLLAYRHDLRREMPATVRALLKKLDSRNLPLTVRPLDRRRFDADLEAIVDIFNDAWSQNWGFVPFTPAEVRHMGANLKPVVRDGFIAIAELDGEPVAMAVSLPNVNEAIADLGGRLLPFGWAKLLWRLKVRGTRSARVPLMGVRRRFHGTPLGAALALGVIDSVRRCHHSLGTEEAELSWILEENLPTRRMIEMLDAKAYKTYRIYEKELA